MSAADGNHGLREPSEQVLLLEVGAGSNFEEEAIDRGHYAGLNTCCTKTVTGTKWLEDYIDNLSDSYRRMVKPGRTNTEFKIGNEEVTPAYRAFIIPVMIYGKLTTLRVEVLNANLPLIISGQTMKKMGVIIDYPHDELTIFGLTKSMIRSPAGHPIIRVFPTVKRERIGPHDIKIISADDERFAEDQTLELASNITDQENLAGNITGALDEMNNEEDPFGNNDEDNNGADMVEDGEEAIGSGQEEEELEGIDTEESENDSDKLTAEGGEYSEEEEQNETPGKHAAGDQMSDKPAKKSRQAAMEARLAAIKSEPETDSMGKSDDEFEPGAGPSQASLRKQFPRIMWDDPKLPHGWARNVWQRRTGGSKGRFDVYIHAPNGRKFRSVAGLRDYFEDTGEKILKWKDFDFSLRGRHTKRKKTRTSVTPRARMKTTGNGGNADNKDPRAPEEATSDEKNDADGAVDMANIKQEPVDPEDQMETSKEDITVIDLTDDAIMDQDDTTPGSANATFGEEYEATAGTSKIPAAVKTPGRLQAPYRIPKLVKAHGKISAPVKTPDTGKTAASAKISGGTTSKPKGILRSGRKQTSNNNGTIPITPMRSVTRVDPVSGELTRGNVNQSGGDPGEAEG